MQKLEVVKAEEMPFSCFELEWGIEEKLESIYIFLRDYFPTVEVFQSQLILSELVKIED